MEPNHLTILWRRVRKGFSKRFNLIQDRAPSAVIDLSFRSGVELSGTTPWVLIIAIFIASIGLNVNSTAVIIGAMLISPLMGPIMGVGYGLGIYDLSLVKKSLFNIAITAFISLATSTLYFWVSPLSEAHSELLARTSPSIWDVLIAFFGGLAGAIGSTRKEKTNLIPGVAIATALMPPLCTAGYGLAKGSLGFFMGALYLFTINSVFIAISTMIVTRYLKLTVKSSIESATNTRIKKLVVATAVLTMIPSVILAYDLVNQEIFNKRAREFIREEFDIQDTHVAATKINPIKKTLEVTLLGKPIDQETLTLIRTKLPSVGLDRAELLVHQGLEQKIDLTAVKDNIMTEVYQGTLNELKTAKAQVMDLQNRLEIFTQNEAKTEAIIKEIAVQYPEASIIAFGYSHGVDKNPQGPDKSSEGGKYSTLPKIPLVTMGISRSLPQDEHTRFENWLRQRTQNPEATLMIQLDKKSVAVQPKSPKIKNRRQKL